MENSMFKGNKSNPEWDGEISNFSVGMDGIAPNGFIFVIISIKQ
jgi:hypothetical protein